MAWWDELKEKAGELAGKAKDLAADTYDWAELELGVKKLQRSISLVEDEIQDIQQKMGARVFELYEKGGIEDEELKGYCGEVDGLKKRIGEYEEEMERLRKERVEAGERAEAAERARDQGEPDSAKEEDD